MFLQPRQMSDCLKQARNWSGRTETNYRFDNKDYNKTSVFNNPNITDVDIKRIYTKNNLETYSPKLLALATKIYDLDMDDLKTHKRMFKHFIFSNSSRQYGAILIASALQTMLGLSPIMTEGRDNLVHVGEGGKHHYGLLTPGKIMRRNYEPGFKEKLLQKFNTTENAYGKLMRFIILDSAYKEGIDLSNIKYVHLFEPLPTYAQEKQAVARAIRFCSHKDMPYDEDEGWKVDVYVYKLFTPKGEKVHIYNSGDGKYEERENVNIDEVIYKLDMEEGDARVSEMMNLLEASAAALSVDFELTKHLIPKPTLNKEGERGVQEQVDHLYDSSTPDGSIASYVSGMYKRAVISKPVKVNNCLYKETYLNEFQKYLADFFASDKSRLGMLLWHSPGSGKTCTALNMVHTLIKNGYKTVCWATNLSLGKKRTECNLTGTNFVIPAYDSRRRPDAPKEPGWMGETYSYKKMITKMSGNLDDHVVIFDETHLLFSDDLDDSQKMTAQNLSDLRLHIEKNWKKPKRNGLPLRVIFLTGTPLTTPTNFFKLMNMIRDHREPAFPETLEDLYQRYPPHSDTTKLRADLDGYISYLDTQSDPSRFAQKGVIFPVNVEMSVRDETTEDAQMDKIDQEIKKNEKKMQTALKRFTTTKKEKFKNDFIELGIKYFQNKNDLIQIKRKRHTRKINQDYSQQTAFEKCKFFQPRIEPVETEDEGLMQDEEKEE